MSNGRIQGPKVVAIMLLVVAGMLAWAFYRYYTVEPEPDRLPPSPSARP